MPYSKLRDSQNEWSQAGATKAKQKVPQLRNQNSESETEASGIVALVRYRVRSPLANIDVLRSTRGQAQQVAAMLKSAGITDVKIEEMLG